ncbi:MAG: GNAT family N-acetyltransferase, partial [Clostridia bacterium]|nr:GNAT family N-acetyltransferase [Clostridia bacterium]
MKHKLSLEKFAADDFSKYYTLVSNKKVMEMITQRAIPFEEAKSKYESLLNNNQLHESFGAFKIIDTETNTFIGYAKLVVKEANSNE